MTFMRGRCYPRRGHFGAAMLRRMKPGRSRPHPVPAAADVVVIGGGIVGCAAAAIMADRGARVVLVEASAIGAGASGRNLGAIQHPFDPVLAELYVESLSRYRALAGATETDFAMPAAPVGLLLLHRDADRAAVQARRMRAAYPELDPQLVSPDELQRLEPALAPGPAAVRLETGYPIPPASATAAWADLAEERGAALVVGQPARPSLHGDRVAGVVLRDGTPIAADAVLVAAGPWSPQLVDPSGRWRPIRPTWGVTIQLRLAGAAPRHVVEEDDVGDSINRAEAATARAATVDADTETDPPSLFSLASAGGISTIGSTFLADEPDEARIGSLLLRRATTFLPSVVEAELVGRRTCARPQSVDGRPFIGPVAGTAGMFVCAGHGPWGISTGPASGAMAARAVLDGTPPLPELEASRPV
jgi:glycine/D-amino acid oxidase-like deaminating enzyme